MRKFQKIIARPAKLVICNYTIELLFSWLKRHLVFKHWYSENENGVRIQLYAGLICFLLLRLYAATRGQLKVRIGLFREIQQHLTGSVTEADLKAYQLALSQPVALTFCFTFSDLVQRN